MKLTKATVDGLKLPPGRTDHFYWDSDLAGFGCRIRSGGSKSWVIQYRNAAGQTRRETLGDGRKVDADLARKEAKRRLARVELGHDPQAEREEARARAKLTLGEQADRYLEAATKLRPSTLNGYRRYLADHWKPLRSRPVHAITKRDVAARLGELVKNHGPFAAARAKQSLSALFAWLIREGIAEVNPCIGTNDPVEGKNPRDRVLDENEVKVIWDTCRDDDFGRIVRLLLLTAARRDEIGRLRWSEIDLETGKLSIPKERVKNNRPLELTLPAMAIDILKATPRQSNREFVFGTRGGAFSRWSWEKLSLDKRIAEAGQVLAPWRLHDLRRTARTGLGRIGVKPHVAELVLNHVGHKSGIGGVYDQHDYQIEIKSALAQWADHVRAIVDGGSRAVVALDTRRAS